MNNLFKGYYRPSGPQFEDLWKKGIFVFDTNVLLNLYRYQPKAREKLLEVMRNLSGRVWLPYHVGLEYQRNRLSIISEQHRKYSDVKGIVSNFPKHIEDELSKLNLKKRHSHINPDKLLTDLKKISDDFVSELTKLESESLQVNAEDKIRSELDNLLANKIGEAPKNQEWLDKIYCEGDDRYLKLIPPGYKDGAAKGDESFTYGGLFYKSKFSDLVIWNQIIDYAKIKKIKNVVFVTDDNKSDWWLHVEGKTISIRPELVEEITRMTEVENFYAYSTDQFLEFANKQSGAVIDQDVLDEVRAVSVRRNATVHNEYRMREMFTNQAILRWLMSLDFEKVEQQERDFPDFIAFKEGQKFGYEVKYLRDVRMVLHRLDELLLRGYHASKERNFVEITIIIVVHDTEDFDRARRMILSRKQALESNVNVILGTIEPEEDNQFGEFAALFIV